jgi:hypothetical protein
LLNILQVVDLAGTYTLLRVKVTMDSLYTSDKTETPLPLFPTRHAEGAYAIFAVVLGFG